MQERKDKRMDYCPVCKLIGALPVGAVLSHCGYKTANFGYMCKKNSLNRHER